MPLCLTIEQKNLVFEKMQKAFSDLPSFMHLVAEPMKEMIDLACCQDFDADFMEKFAIKHLGSVSPAAGARSKDQKKIYMTAKAALYACAVYLCSHDHNYRSGYLASPGDLLVRYPTFIDELSPLDHDENRKELEFLLSFRNYFTIALHLLPAKDNKILFLRILERLEGSGGEYITGTGQKKSTTRRCTIYHQETGIPIRKVPRKNKRKFFSEDDIPENFMVDDHNEVIPHGKRGRSNPVESVSLRPDTSSSTCSSSSSSMMEASIEPQTWINWTLQDRSSYDQLLNEDYEGSFTEVADSVFFSFP